MRIVVNRICRALAVLTCCGVVLTGCGKEAAKAPAGSGQIIAHVGDQVVTTSELENEFRRANIPGDKQKDPAIIKAAVSELVTRKYLLQQALAAKLDQEPSVLLDLIRAREQVLESAYLQRQATAKAPSNSDVEKYISSSPAKFAERKLFAVDQIAFPASANVQSIITANKDAKTLEEVDQQLTSAGIVHGRQSGVLNGAELQPDFYKSLEARTSDQVFFVRSGPNGVFFKVTGEQASPLKGEAAANVARQLMRAEALKAEASLASYSANAEAKYEGEYADLMKK
ncbi:hypothetical protein L6654_39590 [Bradyrhizobium sp. WYCCWR 13023]|uniref:Peptidyl-prolyl cis-trans isomerase, EpsD family n=1 Tax=Bradyrhizobium zhengyangense TaxID=2911009 RepID=A0A9X1RE87_9BRAD|nr:hypothetical protein [Bradyrhizobium zhengyangense]MCG2632707.1 hypothetical protein [Bradyrhizobium zhengyangense]